MKLVVERNTQAVTQPVVAGGLVLMTPPINEDYWLLRVKVGYGQAVVLFPKFSQFGIGFAKETDWNTNLPSACSASEIYQHIKHNKGHKGIPATRCVQAIKLLQKELATLKAER